MSVTYKKQLYYTIDLYIYGSSQGIHTRWAIDVLAVFIFLFDDLREKRAVSLSK